MLNNISLFLSFSLSLIVSLLTGLNPLVTVAPSHKQTVQPFQSVSLA